MRDQSLIKMSDEHKMLCQTLKDWGESSITPFAQMWDKEEELPASLLREAEDLGLYTISLSEERGGAGMDDLAALYAVETLARFEGSLSLKVALLNGPIASCWPKELSSVDGTWAIGTLHITEQGARGVIQDVPWSESTRWLMIPQGSRLYLVDLQSTGVNRSPHKKRLGLRCAEWSDVVLNNVRTLAFPLSREQRIIATAKMNLGWSALALGLGTAGAHLGVQYAGERVQFGKNLTQFQAIQWMISDSVTELEAARLLTYQAARLLQAGSVERGAQLAAEARLLSMEAGHQACDRGLQIHGGYGYTQDYPIERFWRDVQRCFPIEGKMALQKQVLLSLIHS